MGVKAKQNRSQDRRESRAPPYRRLTLCRSHADWLYAVALGALVFLVYHRSWNGGFVFDDVLLLVNNPVIKPGGLAKVWVPGGYLNYWPVTYTAYWLQYQMWGLHSLGYHLVNLALHVFSALLVWRILLRLQVPGAAFAAAIFALHPVNVESVAWIAELKGLLSLALALVSVLFYLSNERNPSRWRYALAIVMFLLSMLAKGAAITLPVVLLACAWWQRGRISRGDLLRVLPYLLIAAIAAGAEIAGQHYVAQDDVVRTDDVFSRLAVAGCALWFYFGKLVFPVGLCPIYPRWTIDEHSVLSYLPGLAWIALLAVAWWKRRTWGRPVVMLIVCYSALLLPVLGFVNITFMRYSLVADHWQYVAMIVPCAVFAAVSTALARRFSKGPALFGAAVSGAALLALLAVLSVFQCDAYRDDQAFYETVLRRNPGCWLAENNLGNFLAKRGQLGLAISHYQRSLDLKPDYAIAYNDMALSFAADGQISAAVANLRRAIEIKPDYAVAYYNLGSILNDRGDFDSARDLFGKAIELRSDFAEPHFGLGKVLAEHGQADAAIDQYQQSLAIEPDYADAHSNLALSLAAKGQTDSAVAHLQKALEIKPDFAEAYYNLGNIMAGRGEFDSAIAQYKKALDIKPDYAEAHNNLGEALLSRADVDSAVAHFQKAVQIKPDYAQAHLNLGNALFGRGSVDAAIIEYKRSLEIKPDNGAAQGNLATALASRGDFDSAIAHYQKAIEIKPDNKVAGTNLSVVLAQRDKILTVVAQQRSAVQAKPNDAAILNELAWALATNPNASIRNGAEAVELAERASKLPGADQPTVLNTLAAAYAEAGRFPDAVRTAEQAERLASAAGNRTLAEQIHSRLELYRSGAPYRQPPSR